VTTPFTKGMCCFRVARLHNPFFVLNTNNTQWPATAPPFLNPQMGLLLRHAHL
jgi:MoxR-like ATPase